MDEHQHTINRRMREILHMYRMQHPEADLPPDSQHIVWDHALLDRLGLLVHVQNLKNQGDVGVQPLYEIPNQFRNTLEFYDYDQHEEDDMFDIPFEEDWEDEGILDDKEVDMHYEPYPEEEDWDEGTNHPTGTFRGESTVPYVGADGQLTTEKTSSEIMEAEGLELWAWYTPRGSTNRPWGIYIRRDAALYIAERFFGDLPDRNEAWWLASNIILNHEYFHFLSQYHCDRISTTSPREQMYVEYDTYMSHHKTDIIEEGAANGYALSKLDQYRHVISDVVAFFSNQPDPYNRFLEFLPPFGARAVGYQHRHHGSMSSSLLASLNPTLDSVFKPTPSFPVPVYVVNQVPRGATGWNLVTFDAIRFSPSVRRQIRRGLVPASVMKKLNKTVNELRGGSIEHLKNLHCMNSKSHFVQKNLPSAWRAIWAQIEGKRGWEIVFVGSHKEYEQYQSVKGL
jgi:hypothetical protein